MPHALKIRVQFPPKEMPNITMGKYGITCDQPSLLMTWKPDTAAIQNERCLCIDAVCRAVILISFLRGLIEYLFFVETPAYSSQQLIEGGLSQSSPGLCIRFFQKIMLNESYIYSRCLEI